MRRRSINSRRDALKSWEVPGLAIAVVRGDETLVLQGVRQAGTRKTRTDHARYDFPSRVVFEGLYHDVAGDARRRRDDGVGRSRSQAPAGLQALRPQRECPSDDSRFALSPLRNRRARPALVSRAVEHRRDRETGPTPPARLPISRRLPVFQHPVSRRGAGHREADGQEVGRTRPDADLRAARNERCDLHHHGDSKGRRSRCRSSAGEEGQDRADACLRDCQNPIHRVP